MNNIIIRKIENDDIWKLFKLSNDETIRKNSFNSSKIKKEEHEKWFKRKITDTNSVIFVALINNKMIGQIRYDIDKIEALIGVGVKTGYRGLGIAYKLFDESKKVIRDRYINLKIIKAFIKKENLDSIKYFKKIGFKFKKEIIINNCESYEYIYKL